MVAAKAIAAAGMRPEIVDAVDDALEGHVDPGAIRAGARMRIAATEDWASEGGALSERIERAAGELADLLARTVPQVRETDEVIPFAQLLAKRTP